MDKCKYYVNGVCTNVAAANYAELCPLPSVGADFGDGVCRYEDVEPTMAEKEYIERDEAVRKALDACIKVIGHGISQIDAVDIAEAIDDIPAADVVEVRHGEWKVVYQNKKATVYECSECSFLCFETSDYCICGAKMDGKGGAE